MNSCLVGMPMTGLRTRLSNISPTGVLGLAFTSGLDSFFYVLDDAQIASKTHMGAFADVNGEFRRPVLRPIIEAWDRATSESIRFIVSGTGFSLNMFKTVLASGVGKASSTWPVVHETGDFQHRALQHSYINQYFPSGFLSSDSGVTLILRMFEWLRGR